MRRRREPTSFLREIGVGLLLSLAAAAIGAALSTILPVDTTLKAIAAALSLSYLLRTYANSRERTGRIVCLLLWALLAGGAWLLDFSLGGYLVLHVVMIWLLRSLYAYSTLIEAAIDLGLSALALCFAVWAALQTDSLFLTIWCFVLVSAAHVAVPRVAASLRKPDEREDRTASNRVFTEAFHAADEALQRLAVRR